MQVFPIKKPYERQEREIKERNKRDKTTKNGLRREDIEISIENIHKIEEEEDIYNL